jgi:hypothetical protein
VYSYQLLYFHQSNKIVLSDMFVLSKLFISIVFFAFTFKFVRSISYFLCRIFFPNPAGSKISLLRNVWRENDGGTFKCISLDICKGKSLIFKSMVRKKRSVFEHTGVFTVRFYIFLLSKTRKYCQQSFCRAPD